MATGKNKSGGLFYETPSTGSSCQCEIRNLTKVNEFAKIRSHGHTKTQDTTSYKGVLDSKKLHTIASILLARRAKNNLNSPRGRFSSDKFSRDEEARLES